MFNGEVIILNIKLLMEELDLKKVGTVNIKMPGEPQLVFDIKSYTKKGLINVVELCTGRYYNKRARRTSEIISQGVRDISFVYPNGMEVKILIYLK